MSEYYTPEISEFHVGFEYESLVDLDDNKGATWHTVTWGGPFARELPSFIVRDFKDDKARVKYLDKTDIESLGFVKIEEPQSILEECYEKDGLVIQTNPFIHENLSNKTRIGHRNFMRDGSGRYKGFYNYFQGTIKNKSELQRVLKMIGYDRSE